MKVILWKVNKRTNFKIPLFLKGKNTFLRKTLIFVASNYGRYLRGQPLCSVIVAICRVAVSATANFTQGVAIAFCGHRVHKRCSYSFHTWCDNYFHMWCLWCRRHLRTTVDARLSTTRLCMGAMIRSHRSTRLAIWRLPVAVVAAATCALRGVTAFHKQINRCDRYPHVAMMPSRYHNHCNLSTWWHCSTVIDN